MKATYVLMALILAWAGAAWGQIAVGDPAPAFSLEGVDGKPYALSDYAGRVVVLEWYNPDCPFVKKHYKPGHMQSLQKAASDLGVVWLTICSSAPGKQGHYDDATHALRADDWGMASTALLLDPDGKVGRAYGAKTTPHMFVVSGDGMLVYQGAIDSVPSTNPADIEEAIDYVTPAIKAVTMGKNPEPASTPPYGCSVKY